MVLAAGSNRVEGAHGMLHVQVWPGDGPPIVAVHGVDASHSVWQPLADALGGARTVVAPDLRGRGASAAGGPFGVMAHAEDLRSVLDGVVAVFDGGSDRQAIDLLGHSFGGHVAALVAADLTAAVDRLVLVDGGPPRLVPEGTTAQQVVDAALANILPQLGNKPHAVSAEAVEADVASMVVDPVGSRPLFDVDAPVHLLRAEFGVAPGLPPVIPDVVVADLVRAGVDVTHQVVAGATHFSILDAPEVVDAVRPG